MISMFSKIFWSDFVGAFWIFRILALMMFLGLFPLVLIFSVSISEIHHLCQISFSRKLFLLGLVVGFHYYLIFLAVVGH